MSSISIKLLKFLIIASTVFILSELTIFGFTEFEQTHTYEFVMYTFCRNTILNCNKIIFLEVFGSSSYYKSFRVLTVSWFVKYAQYKKYCA